MTFTGICIYTENAPRLAAFYETVFQQPPFVEGDHYSFSSAMLAVYNPGNLHPSPVKNLALMYTTPDLLATYSRLKSQIPTLKITNEPIRRPWGAFSFWIEDPDGNTISFIEQQPDET